MKLSIITINLNNAEGLRRTMESVRKQTCKDFEYIVVDGASTDGSVDVINEYESLLNNTQIDFKWGSEPDKGIYNAMNKGLYKSHGEYSLMLNSGDYLADVDVIERVLPELYDDGVIQGSMYIRKKDEKSLDRGYGPSKITFFEAYRGDFLHQAAFIRRDVYEQYGYYDESYRIAGDTVFFLKVLGFHNVTFRYIDVPISVFEGGGVASSSDGKWKIIQRDEISRIEREVLGPRLTKVCKDDYKKVQLYDKLHAYRWSWALTRALSFLCTLIGGKQ